MRELCSYHMKRHDKVQYAMQGDVLHSHAPPTDCKDGEWTAVTPKYILQRVDDFHYASCIALATLQILKSAVK